MTVALTASHDARQTFSICHNDEPVFWLTSRNVKPRSSERTATSLLSRKAMLRLCTCIGLGTCVTLASATAATAPQATVGGSSVTTPEPRIALPPVAEVNFSDLLPADAGSIRTASIEVPTVDAAAADPAGGNDPLRDFEPGPAAETGDVRARIIASMPLTSPEQSEGSEDEEASFAETVDFVRFDEMRVPRWIVDTILRASEATGVDPVYMMALADKESSFLPANKASTSSAEGLFQFIEGTWLEIVRSFGEKYGLGAEAKAIENTGAQINVPDEAMREHILGLRRNPYLSALMAAEMMKRDRAKIESKLGRPINRSEFYFAHFFGVDSASRFMALVDGKPKQSAPRVFPAAAKANKALFFAKSGRKTRQLTVAEVYGKIDDMIDKRLERYEDVSALVTSTADL